MLKMNASQYYCFSDIFFNACDAYLDAASCKQYSTVIFQNTVFSSNEDTESREDTLTVRRMSFEDSGEHRLSGKSDNAFCCMDGAPLSPMVLDDDEDYDETAMLSAEINTRAIFRSDRNNKPSGQRDCADFTRLCRCTAWSMDSNYSQTGVSSVTCGSSTIDRLHWDEMLCDSRELTKRLRLSRVQ